MVICRPSHKNQELANDRSPYLSRRRSLGPVLLPRPEPSRWALALLRGMAPSMTESLPSPEPVAELVAS